MTAFRDLLAAIEARGRTAALRAVAHARAGLLTRAAAELPGVAVTLAGDDLRLRAPGLQARAFGSRRAMPDPRLTGLVR